MYQPGTLHWQLVSDLKTLVSRTIKVYLFSGNFLSDCCRSLHFFGRLSKMLYILDKSLEEIFHLSNYQDDCTSWLIQDKSEKWSQGPFVFLGTVCKASWGPPQGSRPCMLGMVWAPLDLSLSWTRLTVLGNYCITLGCCAGAEKIQKCTRCLTWLTLGRQLQRRAGYPAAEWVGQNLFAKCQCSLKLLNSSHVISCNRNSSSPLLLDINLAVR